MSADTIRRINQNNEAFAASHAPPPTFAEFPNQKATLVISCMDPRADPNDFWATGKMGVPVLRTAGGRVGPDVLTSIRVLAGIMSGGRNTVGAVAVVHHSDCGLVSFSDTEVGTLLVERAGLEGERAAEAKALSYGSLKEYESLDASVVEDMKAIKADPYLPKDLEVVGYVYDVFGGKTREVASM